MSSVFTDMKPAVIVVGYSRPRALKRLLGSINQGDYPHKIKLIISLDGGADPGVISISESFRFLHGDVEVVKREKNIGLRAHILWCGDQAAKYGSVVVLEDDLTVDPQYYMYATSSLSFYKNDKNVCGIALYSPKYNEFAGLPFEALWNGSSSYAMSIPCSWGQAWSAAQWSGFKKWYDESEEVDVLTSLYTPDYVKRWPESSWKKYFSTYMADNSLYFIYPYNSFTTNFSDPGGTHNKEGSSLVQVPLGNPLRKKDILEFMELGDTEVKYDSFMEISEAWAANYINKKPLVIDLYGIKPAALIATASYTVTIKKCKKALVNYSVSMHPLELNICSSAGGLRNPKIVLAESEDVVSTNYGVKGWQYEYWSYFPFRGKKFYLVVFIRLVVDAIAFLKDTIFR